MIKLRRSNTKKSGREKEDTSTGAEKKKLHPIQFPVHPNPNSQLSYTNHSNLPCKRGTGEAERKCTVSQSQPQPNQYIIRLLILGTMHRQQPREATTVEQR
ncbi:hypothetical protein AAHA92_17305 [Salvia divinorum]|uniref:Uncharacterized protein n=1 Tax=Salvia divinorum TaxID=28513 RepID=A0ABD1GYD2_SALDI